MATVQGLLQAGSDLSTDSPRRDAEILLAYCLDKNRAWLYTWPENEVSAQHAAKFEHLLEQRRQGVPVAYLIGEREFWSLPLSVTPATLIPRPETETLVTWALELELPAAAAVLDLGTGSGAIALALASERLQWQLVAVDSSAEALEIACANALAMGLPQVRFKQSDWYQGLAGERFDLLLANPPYIDADDPHLSQGDLRFEPRSALVAQDNGLGDLIHLVEGAPGHLAKGGWLLLEHGYEQGPAVRAMLSGVGFTAVGTRMDMAGQERITGGCWHAE